MTKAPVQTRESGFTLLELLLVIGVAALLLIGGIATYRLVSEGNKATEATRLLLTIRQQSQVLANQQNGSYEGLDYTTGTSALTDPLVAAGVLTVGQRNPFSGNIVVTGNAAGANPQLTVQFTALPRAACIRLMQAITNPSDITNVAGTNGTLQTTFPVTAAVATGACTVANANTNTVTWTFP